MKALFFLLVATVIYVQCNGQFTNNCLPRPMREVPVTLQIKNVSADFRTSVCKDELLAISELADLAEQQIMNQYRQMFDCELVSLRHRSCKTSGHNTHHVTIYYLVNLTCGDKCYYLGQHDRNNRDARKFFSIQVNSLRRAYKTRYVSNFSYNGMLVEVFYFKGRKVDFHFNCDGNLIRDGVSEKKRIPACTCPSSCTHPCELPSTIGRCRGYFPSYHHNATSGQCEQFIYGGCGGNQNRFNTQGECETACNVCPEGMVYKECGTSCPPTCDRKRGLLCTLECVQGCFCNENTVLLEENGEECVAPEECPVKIGSGQECPEGMIYKECSCPTTCDNKDLVLSCTEECQSGCFCKEGTVLQEAGGEKCVAEDECLSKR